MATKTTITHPKANTATGAVNRDTLLQELKDYAPALTVQPSDVVLSGTDIVIKFEDRITAADETGAAAVVAAHQGAAFSSPSFETSAGEPRFAGFPGYPDPVSATDETWVTLMSHDSGPLPAGKYEVLWSSKHWLVGAWTQDPDTNRWQWTGESAHVRVILEDPPVNEAPLGDNPLLLGEDSTTAALSDTFADGFFPTLKAGEQLKFRLQVRKVATGSAVAHLASGRMSYKPIA